MVATKHWFTSLALLLTLLLCGAAAAQNAAPGKTFVMKLATPTLNDGQHEWMRRFAAAIEAKSGGRIKAELYPASQLGSIPRMIEGTQLGSIQIFLAPPEFFVGVDQRFELMTAAGLMGNDEQAIKTLSDPEFSKAFLAIGVNKGLIGVSLFFGSPSAFVMAQSELADARRILTSSQQHHRAILEALAAGASARAESIAREHSNLAKDNLHVAAKRDTPLDKVAGGSLIRLRMVAV